MSPVAPVRVVVDSSACFDPGEARALPIEVVPLGLAVAGVTYRDGLDLDPSRFYALQASGVPVSSSAPSPGAYLQAFGEDGRDVLCLTIAEEVSGAYRSALVARGLALERDPDRAVLVVDSRRPGPASGSWLAAAPAWPLWGPR